MRKKDKDTVSIYGSTINCSDPKDRALIGELCTDTRKLPNLARKFEEFTQKHSSSINQITEEKKREYQIFIRYLLLELANHLGTAPAWLMVEFTSFWLHNFAGEIFSCEIPGVTQSDWDAVNSDEDSFGICQDVDLTNCILTFQKLGFKVTLDEDQPDRQPKRFLLIINHEKQIR